MKLLIHSQTSTVLNHCQSELSNHTWYHNAVGCHYSMVRYLPSSLSYKTHCSRQLNCWSLTCSWSIACRRCSNYIFILHLTLSFNILHKDNCKPRWERFKFLDLVRLILEILRYIPYSTAVYQVLPKSRVCTPRRRPISRLFGVSIVRIFEKSDHTIVSLHCMPVDDWAPPGMDIWLYQLWCVGWNYLSIPKLQQCSRWSLGMNN